MQAWKWRSIRKPLRYLDSEIGRPALSEKKWRKGVRWLLVFPDVYEVGMSSFGFSLLYHLINTLPDAVCDRLFAPWRDYLELILSGEEKLVSLERQETPSAFDVIGFSLSTELHIPTAVKLMDMMRSQCKGNENTPLFIAGGPVTSNPAPLHVFFDAVFAGEAEEAVAEINEIMLQQKRYGGSRRELLEALAGIEGMYVPAVHGRGKGLTSLSVKVKRRVVADLEKNFHPKTQMVPLTSVLHERVMVEVARGCPRGCRFCLATFIYRPLREREPGTVEALAKEIYKNTGFQEISLLSLSTGDYSALEDVIRRLYPFCQEHTVSLTLPSIRISTLSEDVVRMIADLGKRGMTIAPEGGTERIRKVINKWYTDDEVVEQAVMAFRHGWQHVKLYFMVGLPREDEEDVVAIARLVRRIYREARRVRRKVQIDTSVSFFVPKPHTPFQWHRADFEEMRKHLGVLKKEFKNSPVRVKWHDLLSSRIENFLARAGWDAAKAVREAVDRGAYLETWTEFLHREMWIDVLKKYGECSYPGGKVSDELPWSFVDTGVNVDFLKKDYKRALDEQGGLDCSAAECHACGICGGAVRVRRARPEGVLREKGVYVPESTSETRVRIRYSRFMPAALMSAPEMLNAFVRAFRRAGVRLKYRGAHNPRPVVSAGVALPVGVESCEEYMDAVILGSVRCEELSGVLNSVLNGTGLQVEEARELRKDEPSIFENTSGAEYLLYWENEEDFKAGASALERIKNGVRMRLKRVNKKEHQLVIQVEADENKNINIFKVLEINGVKADILKRVRVVKTAHEMESHQDRIKDSK